MMPEAHHPLRSLRTAGAALALGALLGGCAVVDGHLQPAGTAPVCPEVGICAPGATDAMLLYHADLSERELEDLRRARRGLDDPGNDPVQQMRQAILLGHPRGSSDTPRALALLEQVLDTSDPQAEILAPLARVLQVEFRARQRLGGEARSSAARLEVSEIARQDLEQKLQALTAIEATLPARPSPDSAVPSGGD